MIPGTGNHEPRKKNLLYFSVPAMNIFFRGNDVLPVKCPVCETEYTITKEDYFDLKRE